MRKLNKIAAPALLAALVLGAASPAMAQHRNHQWNGNQIRAQISELERRIDRNDGRNRISQREAAGLRRDVRALRNQYQAFNRNGLDRGEIRTLNNRIDNIRTRLHIESRDWNNRRW